MSKPQLILASASPRRAQLLQQIGLKFEVAYCPIIEANSVKYTPQEIVIQNAHQKASLIAAKLGKGLVIGADTVVVLEGQIFGKPRNPADAARMLTALSGKTHNVYTGVSVVDA